MIKHFCDWCGKEIPKRYTETIPTSFDVKFPILMQKSLDGVPFGELFIKPAPANTKEYEICTECLVKMWKLRKEGA